MKTMMLRVGKAVAAGTVMLACSVGVCSAQTAAPPATTPGQSPTISREQATERIEAARREIEERQRAGVPPAGVPGAPANTPQNEWRGGRGEPKIDLDFRGGTPAQLVDAIEKATKEPLNAIIREEDRNVNLPPLKVRDVTVENLFAALEQASRHSLHQVAGYTSSGHPHIMNVSVQLGFKRQGNLWVFRHERPLPAPQSVAPETRFYSLEPYLDKYSIEDITTAVKTAWAMMSESKAPTISTQTSPADLKFHKETKLLIAVGNKAQVQVIDDALKALRPDLGSAQVNAPEPQRRTNAPVANPTSRE